MKKETLLSVAFILACAFAAIAQETAIKPVMLSGDVVSIAPEKIVVKTKDGDSNAALTEKTTYIRVPPENTSQKLPSAISEIAVGDKVIVSALPNADKSVLTARTVYLMSKSDIALRQQKSDQDWKQRGTVGKVDNYSPLTKTITITTRVMGADKKVTVKPKESAEFWRYAPDSIDFAKAKQSALGDILPGDEIRVLGTKNADGTEIEAEKVVTGAFQTKGGTIKAINVEKNEVVISDSTNSKKDIVIKLGDSSVLKQFPAELATRLAQIQMMSAMGGMGGGMMRPPGQGGGGQGGGGQMTPPTGGQPNGQPNGATPGGAGGFRPGGGGGMGGGAIDDSRFPTVKITDLKVGEIIGVLSSRSADAASIHAIKLFTGVEPFVKAAQAAAQARGGQGGGQGGGGGASLSIPGLDGFGGN